VTAALEMRGVCRRFGAKAAVDHLDLLVPEGSFYALLRPNGARNRAGSTV
jgi:ABC-type uncharacterized transport system, ATPase component